MNNTPLVSIVVPVYNVETFLQNCIENILQQTYQNYELILVNDGSKDKSAQICEMYALKDSRIKIIHKANEGAGSARNAGIKEATGEFITFPDADDILYPNMLEVTVGNMINDKVDLVIFSYENIIVDGLDIKAINKNRLMNITIINNKRECRKLWFEIRKINISQLNTPWNKLYKTNIIKENNIMFPNIRRAQDAVFNLYYYDRISSICVIDDIFYGYNSNDQERIWMKFPKNSIDFFVEYNKTMETIIHSWEMYYGEYKTLCDNNLIGNIDLCILLYKNPKWGLNLKQKIMYIRSIITNSYIKYRIDNYSGNIEELNKYSHYIRKVRPLSILVWKNNNIIKSNIRERLISNKHIYSFVRYIKGVVKNIKLH